MDANSLLKKCLIDTISGDYENISLLRSQLPIWSKECRQDFSEGALLTAIDEAIRTDLIRAYKYNNAKLHSFQQCEFHMESIDEYWFLKTGGRGYPHNL
jgi:hypothetical protein